MPQERLSKFLSNSGIASRRKCDSIIASGRVKVNNVIILEPYYKVSYKEDIITVDDIRILPSLHSIYLAFYKPINVLSDLSAEKRSSKCKVIHCCQRLYISCRKIRLQFRRTSFIYE